MTGRGMDPTRSRRGRKGVHAPSVSSLDPDYNPNLSQVLIEPEGAFRDTHSRIAIPYGYDSPLLPQGLYCRNHWEASSSGQMMKKKPAAMLSLPQLARNKQRLCRSIWPTATMIMTSIGVWRLKSKLWKFSKQLWIIFSKYWRNS